MLNEDWVLMMIHLFQILSSLDIIIPMHLLLKIFKSGVEHIQSDVREAEELQAQALPQSVLYQTSPAHEAVSPMSPQRFPVAPDPCDLYERDTELVLPCFIIMLDILLKQVAWPVQYEPSIWDSCLGFLKACYSFGQWYNVEHSLTGRSRTLSFNWDQARWICLAHSAPIKAGPPTCVHHIW